jgi:SAM-dependent methyltransferase
VGGVFLREIFMGNNWLSTDKKYDDAVLTGRNDVANHHVDCTAEEICKRSLGISLAELAKMLEYVQVINPDFKLEGTGIELGAGAGLLSTEVLLQFSQVERLYAVEISGEHVLKIMPSIASQRLTPVDSDKLYPVIGDFDDIHLESESLDFAIEINSLHHSNDLKITLNEIFRLMKPGAKLVFFDRSHPDFTTSEDIERMLNLEYNIGSLEGIGFKPGTKMTRRDNGEHEYRVTDWSSYFTDAGFTVSNIVNIGERFSLSKVIRASVARTPMFLRFVMFHFVGLFSDSRATELLIDKDIRPRNGEFMYQFGNILKYKRYPFKRKMTIFLLKKPNLNLGS